MNQRESSDVVGRWVLEGGWRKTRWRWSTLEEEAGRELERVERWRLELGKLLDGGVSRRR